MDSIKLWAHNGKAVRQAIELGELVHIETASEELTLASGPARRYAAPAWALAMKGNALNLRDPAVPASTVFHFMPTPRFRHIGGIS